MRPLQKEVTILKYLNNSQEMCGKSVIYIEDDKSWFCNSMAQTAGTSNDI